MRGAQIRGAAHFREVCDFARGLTGLSAARAAPARRPPPPPQLDLIDVRGQPYARRALEIAAAGEHSLLLIGPPGAGKSMLAQRLPGILPPMSEEEAFEAAAIRSLTGHGHRSDEWGERVRDRRAVRYDITFDPDRGRWYLDASWKTSPATSHRHQGSARRDGAGGGSQRRAPGRLRARCVR